MEFLHLQMGDHRLYLVKQAHREGKFAEILSCCKEVTLQGGDSVLAPWW